MKHKCAGACRDVRQGMAPKARQTWRIRHVRRSRQAHLFGHRSTWLRQAVAAFLLVGLAASTSAEETAPSAEAEVSVRDVHAVALELAADIEALRAYIGAPAVDDWTWSITEAVPRHLFYMAQVLYRKSNELVREMTNVPSVAMPPLPTGEVGEDDALALLTSTHIKLKGVATRMRAPISTDSLAAPSARPAVVMASMVMTSRQLNAMLHREFRHPDVYRQIENAVGHAAQLANGYPPLPPLEAGRATADVYRQVIDSLELLRRLAVANDLAALRLNFRRERRRTDVVVADVYGLATLAAADLAWLTPRLREDGAEAAPALPYASPSPIFPSHTYRLAFVLVTQLRTATAGQ